MSALCPDLLIVGAGPVGCVIAERAASTVGWSSLVIDRRRHLAGNCHDRAHGSGVLVHEYGPHYFRTDNAALVEYLSRFTDWIPGRYVVKSRVGDRLLPFPVNLTTLEEFFGRKLDAAAARALLAEKCPSLPHLPRNSEELVLSRVGRELYEAFYLGYTLKQWERHPRELPPSVCGRIPVRFDRDERYVSQRFQLMPARGFTEMFARMLAHPKIELRLGVQYRELRSQVIPRVATVYCGAIDEFFDHALGKLPWRSLSFEHVEHAESFRQPCVQINYPDTTVDYTRTVEYKHVTGQAHPRTVVSYERPRAGGEPFYPVPTSEATALYGRYRELAKARENSGRPRVYFSGRLATYRYLNTDEAIEGALETLEKIQRDWLPPNLAQRSAILHA